MNLLHIITFKRNCCAVWLLLNFFAILRSAFIEGKERKREEY